jgi:hypothetical protein
MSGTHTYHISLMVCVKEKVFEADVERAVGATVSNLRSIFQTHDITVTSPDGEIDQSITAEIVEELTS